MLWAEKPPAPVVAARCSTIETDRIVVGIVLVSQEDDEPPPPKASQIKGTAQAAQADPCYNSHRLKSECTA